MYDGVIQELIDQLGRLPGVGPKSAQRIAFHLIETDSQVALELADVLREAKEKVRFCQTCGNVSEAEQCSICLDPKRETASICVVEDSKDINSIETLLNDLADVKEDQALTSNEFNGLRGDRASTQVPIRVGESVPGTQAHRAEPQPNRGDDIDAANVMSGDKETAL